jgi:hypothetical protein
MTSANIQKIIRAEFKRWEKRKRVARGDLIWVLTGADTSWEEGSDTRRRLENGIILLKKLLSGQSSPKIYVSGWNEHNTNLRRFVSKGLFNQAYDLPKGKLIVGRLENIRHTGDQFEKFPKKLLTAGQIVIVTDSYHIPRVMRYVERYFNNHTGRISYYPARPLTMTRTQVNTEIRKIIEYSKRNIIPLFLAHKKRIAITGASGFLGSNLTEALQRRSDTVVQVYRKRDGFEKPSTLKEFVRGADVVFHLAGVKSADSDDSFLFNLNSTKTIIAAMRKAAPDALLVFASSFSVYGSLQSAGGFTERSIPRPLTSYGKSKRACERLIEISCRKYGLRAVVLRISNVYRCRP